MKVGIRRAIALCLAMLMLTACSTVTPPTPTTPTTPVVPDTTEPSARSPFTLVYSRADSLHPFLMTSRVNRELCTLLYEGLTVLDDTMHPQLVLADEVTVQGQTVTVRLASNAVFSDGTPVTTADVISSFEAAKTCPAYRALLAGVTKAEGEEDSTTVIFRLDQADPFAAACLTFPVVHVTEDGTVLGSGPYVFDPAPRLIANPQRDPVAYPEIRLLDLVNDDECAKGVELGNVTYFYSDLSEGEIPRVSGATSVVSTEFSVFLGVNTDRTMWKDATMRRAVSLALDRTQLAQRAFAGYADPATTPFPTAFAAKELLSSFAAVADREQAMALLSENGYAVPGTTVSEARQATVSLLVCNDNTFKTALADLVASQLETVGFGVTVVSLPYDDYYVALRNGRCDLYIGEVRMTANMDLFPLLDKHGAASFGVDTRGAGAESYRAFRDGAVSVQEFAAVFCDDLPYIPLCYRKGMAMYDRALTNVTPSAFNAYADLNFWKLVSS